MSRTCRARRVLHDPSPQLKMTLLKPVLLLQLRASSSSVVCVCRLVMVAVFTARRYASAVYAVVVCPSVSLSVCHKPVLCQNR